MTQRLSTVIAAAAIATLLGVMAVPARAAMSEALDSEGGSVRLVAAAPEADGRIPAVLDIKLKPGWKTYWRDPGGSGIPPSVTLPEGSGVRLNGIAFPAPKHFNDGTVRYVGYDRSVALPLSLTRQDDSAETLAVSVFLGICRDICIPVQGDLRLTLDKTAAPLDRARIDAAQKALPEAPSNAFRLTESRINATGTRIDLAVMLPEAGATPDLFVSGPDGFVFGQPEILSREGATVTASITVRQRPGDAALEGPDVHLVVRAGTRSMETPLAFD